MDTDERNTYTVTVITTTNNEIPTGRQLHKARVRGRTAGLRGAQELPQLPYTLKLEMNPSNFPQIHLAVGKLAQVLTCDTSLLLPYPAPSVQLFGTVDNHTITTILVIKTCKVWYRCTTRGLGH